MIDQEVIDHLRALSTGDVQPMDPKTGVCHEMSSVFDIDLSDVDYTDWPKWSGLWGHPVPASNDYGRRGGYLTAITAYQSTTTPNWAADEYGDNRREFCAFLADQFDQLNKEAAL